MSALFSTLYLAFISFEGFVVALMLLAILTPMREYLLHPFLSHTRNLTKLGILTQWVLSTLFVALIWWLSGLSMTWLLVSFGLDVIAVPATLWFRKVANYSPVHSEMLAG